MYGLQLNDLEKFQNFSDEFNIQVLAFKENNFISLDVFRNLYRKDKALFHKIVSEAILKGHIFKLEKASVLFPEIKVKNDEYIHISKTNLNNQDFKKIDFSKIGIANEMAQFDITDNYFFQAIPLDGFDVFNISNFNKKILYSELEKVNFDVVSLSQLKQNLMDNNLTHKIKIHKFIQINNHLNAFSSDSLIKEDKSSFTNTNDINTEKKSQLTNNKNKSVNNVNKVLQIRILRKIINHCLLNNVSIKRAISDEALVNKLNDNNIYLFRNFIEENGEDVLKNYSQSECKTITDAARKLAQNKELLEDNFYKYLKQHRFNTSKIRDFYFSNKVESIVVKLIKNNINYISNFNKKVIYQLFNDVDIKTIIYFIDEIKKETCYQDDYTINQKIPWDTKQLIINKISEFLEVDHFITFKQLFNKFKFDRKLVIDFINQQRITTLEYFIKIIKKLFPNYINYENDYLYDVRFFDDLTKMQIILKKYGDEYHRVTKNIILDSLTNDFNCSNKTRALLSALKNNEIMKLDDEFYIDPQDIPLISQDDISRINNILLEKLNNNNYLLLKPIRISRKLSRLAYPYSWSPQLIEYIATHLLDWQKVDSSLYKQETTIITLKNSKVNYETVLQSEFRNFEGEKYEKVVYEQFDKLGLINNRGDNKTIPSQIKQNLFKQDELGYLSLR